MRISGFTIARQVIDLDYPLQESLRSLLPLVDELIVNVGDVNDGTWEAVGEIADPKIVAFRSEWDMTRRGGQALSEETNKALARCRGDWAVYLQSDEVLHEADTEGLRAALQRFQTTRVEALSLRYFHFCGSYQQFKDDPRHWYRRATRIVRTGVGVESVGDACAFMVREGACLRRPRRRDLPQYVYHYGRARPAAEVLRKQRNLDRFYDAAPEHLDSGPEAAARYVERTHLREFLGTHPAVMGPRIAAADWDVPPRRTDGRPEWLRRAHVYTAWVLVAGAAWVRRQVWSRIRLPW